MKEKEKTKKKGEKIDTDTHHDRREKKGRRRRRNPLFSEPNGSPEILLHTNVFE